MITETDTLMLEFADREAQESRDPSTQVGAVLSVHGGPRIFGHNTFIGLKDPAKATREERYEDVVHAEEVVLIRAGRRANGATVYCTHEPCGKCYRRMVLAGVRRIVHRTTSDDRRGRWGCEAGRSIARACGVEVVGVDL